MPDLAQPRTPDVVGDVGLLERFEEQVTPAKGWTVLLHNDPVNLAEYVTKVLCTVFHVSTQVAQGYMITAHTEGKAAVFQGSKDEAVEKAAILGSYSLWASTESDD